MVQKTLLVLSVLLSLLIVLTEGPATSRTAPEAGQPGIADAGATEETASLTFISDIIRSGESFFDIFKKNNLDTEDLYEIGRASAGVYDLGMVTAGRTYSIGVDEENRVQAVSYSIDDFFKLDVKRSEEGFSVEKVPVEYEARTAYMGGTISDNLVSALDDQGLAIGLSDIFAWDIDFTSDLRKGDSFKLVVEELLLDGQFKRYGRILSAEFVNNGHTYRAHLYEHDGESDYYDDDGKSVRRAFLKAPLSYRRISSGFTKRRFHPVLKINRPHLGIDYAAPSGTPVSSVGDGTVLFAGWKGANGKLIIIRHPNGYTTYYGHLSRIERGIHKGKKVTQGQIIGRVGATGRATGPHLDYRIKLHGSFVNPLALKMPRGGSVPGAAMPEFIKLRDRMNEEMTAINVQDNKG